MKKIVILGAGTGGCIVANKLVRTLDPAQWSVTVIDKADRHYYQPGFIFLPFRLYGYRTAGRVSAPIRKPLAHGVNFVAAEVNMIDHANRKVETSAGVYDYDFLVSAMGCRVAPEEVPGMAEGMGGKIHTFYTLDGAMAMQKALDEFTGGEFVVHISESPFKCPVAPLEFMFLADYYFTRKGIRHKTNITLVTPLSGAFTKPIASAKLMSLAERRNIKIVPNFVTMEVDGEKGLLSDPTGKEVSFDLLATIPPNLGPEVIDESGLGNGAGYLVVDKGTLKSEKAERIYGLGDNTNVPTSKAGSVAHFQAEILVENLLAEIDGRAAAARSDGHSNCFIETGFHKAILVDFNYDIEPLPGKFPFPLIGPMTLLGESYANHYGKMGFDWLYWNLLLSARFPDGPWAPCHMSMAGKDASWLTEKGKLPHYP
ncbi:MAG: FAD-dependent oxidoreductase [Nitrospinae bacterium]|nr:FAD-dependent oxidoreductase [Nitrospinota bacterium]